ncbi:MAG: phosphatidate cytidylyltransferase [Holophagaceae bacterium]|nr:phosphatidate cytidylyltransferase [Holophagaceae bacterium]
MTKYKAPHTTLKAETGAITPPVKPAFDQRNMVVRISTALVFAVFFLSLLYWGGGTTWGNLTYFGLMGVSIFVGVRELTLLGRKMGFNPSLYAATALAWLLLMHFFLASRSAIGEQPLDPDILPLWLAMVFGIGIIHFGALFFDEKRELTLPSQAITLMGALYMGLGLGFQQRLFMLDSKTVTNTGGRMVLALYIIVWLGDTGAYFIGSFFGRHKLAPKVSPKKSWEGLVGNYLGNVVGAWLMKATGVCPDWSPVDVVALGLLLGTVGQLGDLVESTWKRSAGVKDSNIGIGIPGHGGMLDRVDSLVFAAPALFAYVHYVHGLG